MQLVLKDRGKFLEMTASNEEGAKRHREAEAQRLM
jgi:hypothetical protein